MLPFFISHFLSERLAPEDAHDEGKGGHPSGDTREVFSKGADPIDGDEDRNAGGGIGGDEAEEGLNG